MPAIHEIERVEPKSAKAWEVKRGQRVRVIDLEGSQVADLVAFNPDDHTEHLSQGHTRMNLFKTRVNTGDTLYSSSGAPMFTLVADDVGVHDITFPPCNARVFQELFDVQATGCWEHLCAALEPYGVNPNLVTDPFNVFMASHVDQNYALVIDPPRSKAGDAVVLRAEGDYIVAVSSCAAEVTDCNGESLTAIGVQILD
jgi:uncharacterized protein